MGISYVDAPPATADVVVIGGGIVGAATAFHLARAGLRPVIVERRPALCTLTTAAAAGGFRLQLDTQEEVAVVGESVELFRSFAEATGQREYDPRVRDQGYLWVTTTSRGAERQLRLAAEQQGWGVDGVEVLPGDEARARFPYLAPEVTQVRFRQGDGLIDPKALAFGLAAGSAAPVAVGTSVTGFELRADRLAAVRTDRGTISTQRAVIACGPLSGLLATRAGVTLPIETIRRHKLTLPDVPEVPTDAPMTIDEDTGAHWRPAFAGAWALFTDPATPPTPPEEAVPSDPGFAFQVLDPASPAALARVTPFWREVWERGSAHWLLQAGQYTMTPDRRPLIGETEVEGMYVNTGYSGHGVMASPAASRILAEVISEKRLGDDNPFRPDRAFAAPHQGVL